MYQHIGRTQTYTKLFFLFVHNSTQYQHLLKTDVYLNYIQEFSSYLTENTIYVHYKDQIFHAVWVNNHCLL